MNKYIVFKIVLAKQKNFTINVLFKTVPINVDIDAQIGINENGPSHVNMEIMQINIVKIIKNNN